MMGRYNSFSCWPFIKLMSRATTVSPLEYSKISWSIGKSQRQQKWEYPLSSFLVNDCWIQSAPKLSVLKQPLFKIIIFPNFVGQEFRQSSAGQFYCTMWCCVGPFIIVLPELSGLEGLRCFYSQTWCLRENGRKLGWILLLLYEVSGPLHGVSQAG